MQAWDNSDTGARFFAHPTVLQIYTPQSSVIAHIFYMTKKECVVITFRTGTTYNYFDVPLHVFLYAFNADSAGTWYNENIRGKYDFAQRL